MIKRVIYVDSENEIDFDNVGVHFTSDLGYNHHGGGSNGATEEKNVKVTIFAAEFQIFEEATAISNEGYPTEKEVILTPSQSIHAQIEYQNRLSFGGYGRPYKTENRNINTGSRMDAWVEKLI